MTTSVSHENNGIGYKICAVSIFLLVAITFVFPSNSLIPFDRKTIAVLGATACYLSREFIFRGTFDIIGSIDFEVLVLLASIMVINHVVVNLKEAKLLIRKVQLKMVQNPVQGFWLISFLAFFLSPFLTNDGVCLLFVDIIIAAFNDQQLQTDDNKVDSETPNPSTGKLQQSDAFFYLVTLACSSNIGSALTYTGNPQNMIVGQEAIQLLSPIRFLAYMLVPALTSWAITTYWLQRCWMHHKSLQHNHTPLDMADRDTDQEQPKEIEESNNNPIQGLQVQTETRGLNLGTGLCHQRPNTLQLHVCGSSLVQRSGSTVSPTRTAILSPRKKRAMEREAMITSIVHVVSSPFPYMVMLLVLAMIIMIFVNVMPIAGLVCTSAVVIVGSLVLGNLWQGKEIWAEENSSVTKSDALSLTRLERIESINEFFDSLFASIDYALLMIFLGTFIVVANVDSTGLPRQLWSAMVGKVPFQTASSLACISTFILVASQLLGNVAVVQLARPNVQALGDNEKILAWSIISFVSTIGGNLTITGSAANIIVAERASRLAPTAAIDFFRHFNVCFWVTLLCCTMGAAMITLIAKFDTKI